MTDSTPDSNRSRQRFVTILCAVFFTSGFAALLYQVAWQRILTVIYGVGSVSTVLIVSIYMLGLGVGAFFGGRLAERVRAPLLVYATVEVAIAMFGVVSVPFLGALAEYTAGVSYRLTLAYVALFLLVPTLLMGATLPLVIKVFSRTTNEFFASVSWIYFLNTIGAAFGALVAAYGIVSFFGLDAAVYTAAVMNALLAGLVLAARHWELPPAESRPPDSPRDAEAGALGRLAYPVVFVTGFLAVGYEIIWFRINMVLTKNSPYSFASVLFVYLVGIAFGSYAINRYWDRLVGIRKRDLFFALHLGIAGYVATSICGYYWLTGETPLRILTRLSFSTFPHPNLPGIVGHAPGSLREWLEAIYTSADIFLWPIGFLLVPTLLMGAAFPLVSLLSKTSRGDEGRTVGTVYFFNILGNVLGGVLTGFVLLPVVGSERTLLAFVIVGLLLGGMSGRVRTTIASSKFRGVAAAAAVVALIAAFPGPGDLYRVMHPGFGAEFATEIEEGEDAVVMTSTFAAAMHHFINGVPHGGRPSFRSYFEIAEVAASVPSVADVLLIGFGTGVYAEALMKLPDLETLTLVELSGSAMANLRKTPYIDELVRHPRLDLVIEDGRRVLQGSEARFDLVVMDPMHPQSAYSNNIYSQEYFELVRSRLAPTGALLVYNAYDGVLINTVLEVFPYVRVYRNFCIASTEPLVGHPSRRDAVLAGLTRAQRAKASGEGRYLGDREALVRRLAGYPVNRDWRPVAEYFLGAAFRGGKRLDWGPADAVH